MRKFWRREHPTFTEATDPNSEQAIVQNLNGTRKEIRFLSTEFSGYVGDLVGELARITELSEQEQLNLLQRIESLRLQAEAFMCRHDTKDALFWSAYALLAALQVGFDAGQTYNRRHRGSRMTR